jgi:pimeloyl-ACP methyl ester carboxylesterase
MVAALGETIGGAPVAWHAALFLPSSPSPALAFSCRYEAGAARSTVCVSAAVFPDALCRRARVRARCRCDHARIARARGFSDPAASLFVEDGKGFLGDTSKSRPLPPWLSEADPARRIERFPHYRADRSQARPRAWVLPNLKGKLIIDGAGHWVQQERANEVNAVLIAFLNERGASHAAQVAAQ